MSEDLGHLTDEDFEAIERIVEGGLDRQHGEHILDAVADHAERQGPEGDPVLQLLSRAHETKPGDE
jgi:hypothetical protein